MLVLIIISTFAPYLILEISYMADFKQVLKDRGYTISAMAEKLGISQSALSQQIGNGSITFAKVEQIARIIGVSVSELVADNKSNTSTFVCPHCGKTLNISIDVS